MATNVADSAQALDPKTNHSRAGRWVSPDLTSGIIEKGGALVSRSRPLVSNPRVVISAVSASLTIGLLYEALYSWVMWSYVVALLRLFWP